LSTSARYSNQTAPKYKGKEPYKHKKAKLRIVKVLQKRGYATVVGDTQAEEFRTPELMHKGCWISFPIDIYAEHMVRDRDRFFIQVDGAYHFASKIQAGRTKNRDMTLSDYARGINTKYIVLTVEEVLNEGTTEQWILEKLKIQS
jgi:hypothetical protein